MRDDAPRRLPSPITALLLRPAPLLAIGLALATTGCSEPWRIWRRGGNELASMSPPSTSDPKASATVAQWARSVADEAPKLEPAESRRLAKEIQERLTTEPSDWNRRELVLALAALQTPETLPGMTNALADPSSTVREAACTGLGSIKSQQAIRLLGNTLATDNNLDVRLAAARELGHHRRPEAVLALAAVLDDPDAALRHRAMVSLGSSAPQDFGGDATAWKQYAANLMMDMDSPASMVAEQPDGSGPHTIR